MNIERLYSILQGPHVTEKVTDIGDESNQYAFKVDTRATKKEIKQAVEQLYDVSVENVTTLRVKGKKTRRLTRSIMEGRKKHWKKAYVRVKPDDRIDFTLEIN